MKATIEITMYPLRADYEEQVLQFLGILRQQGNFELKVNAMSTQISGDYEKVFPAVQEAIAAVYANGVKAAFVLKILPVALDLNPDFTGLF